MAEFFQSFVGIKPYAALWTVKLLIINVKMYIGINMLIRLGVVIYLMKVFGFYIRY